MLITCSAVNGCQEPRRLAHLTALTQPHGVRNRCFAYRSPGERLDDRRNRGCRQFGHARVLETGEHRVGPPAERGGRQQVSQQQTSPANKWQNLQPRPPAGEVQLRITGLLTAPSHEPARLIFAKTFHGACVAAAPALIATDFSASVSQRARWRAEKARPASNFRSVIDGASPLRGSGSGTGRLLQRVRFTSLKESYSRHADAAFPPRLMMADRRPTLIQINGSRSTRPIHRAIVGQGPRAGIFTDWAMIAHSPHVRTRPRSPGIPPGKSRTLAASRKPCSLRSRSQRR
jgi:hypothetical protein